MAPADEAGAFFSGSFECPFAVFRFRDCGLFSACGSEMAAQRSDRRTSDINTPLIREFRRAFSLPTTQRRLLLRAKHFARIGQTESRRPAIARSS